MKQQILSLGGLFLGGFLQAAVFTVDDDGPADFTTIQAAIGAAQNGDTILVANGIYTGPGNRDLDFLGKAISVCSQSGPENCLIDCGASAEDLHRGFYFHSGEGVDSVVDGFTIRNGVGPKVVTPTGWRSTGGGIHCDGSSPTIVDTVFADNTAYYGGGMSIVNGGHPRVIRCAFVGNAADAAYGHGGGLYLFEGDAHVADGIFSENRAFYGGAISGGGSGTTFLRCMVHANAARSGGGISDSHALYLGCRITANTASDDWDGDGGGIHCWDCNPTLFSCLVAANTATQDGGGIYSGYLSKPTITHCTVADNQAGGRGGGLACDWSHAVVRSSILHGNQAEWGAQIAVVGHVSASSLAVFQSDIQAGRAGVYTSGRHIVRWGNGNIDADPGFLDGPNGNYRLAPSSPCIDAGGPYYHLWGNLFVDAGGGCRLNGAWVDLGCYEFGALPDRDGDLLSDSDEAVYQADPDRPDSDGDGLPDGVEVLRGTNPTVANSAAGILVPEQYPAIQQGLFLAFPGEVVTVGPGIYYENLHFQGKNVILQSGDPTDPKVVEATLIDGQGTDTVVTFQGTETPDCVLSGFTITNGGFSGIRGNGCEAVIENNRIVGNTVPSLSANAGGAGLFDCDGLIQSNRILGNQAEEGGGGLSHCDGTIRHNVISHNDCGYRGGGLMCCGGLMVGNIITGNYGGYGAGGIYCDQNSGPTIVNCLIAGNTTCGGNYGHGGGIFLEGSGRATLIHCTITGNEARGNGGWGGGVYCYYGDAILSNCIVYGNAGLVGRELSLRGRFAEMTVAYSNVRGGSSGVEVADGSLNWGEGNFDAEPGLVRLGYRDGEDAWVEGDYHLKFNSPCIDAGTDAAVYDDMEGNQRPFDFPFVDANGAGPDFDVGAYETIAREEGELIFLPGRIRRAADSPRRFLAYLRMPEGYSGGDIDTLTPMALFPGGIESKEQAVHPPGAKPRGGVVVRAVFDRAELLGAVGDPGVIGLTVMGRFKTGEYFYTTADLTIYD